MTTPAAPINVGPTNRSLLSKATAAVASSPSIALGIIIVLAIIAIATIVYYRGLFFGPYYKQAPAKSLAPVSVPAREPPPPVGDAETQRLIDSINGVA